VTEEDSKGVRSKHWMELMVEARVSRGLRVFHLLLAVVSVLLVVAAVVACIAAFFVFDLLEIALALTVVAIVVVVAASWHRRHLVDKVRWVDGTVTFRSVEPGDTSEDGQYVECRVDVNPPADITRVATRVGPLDAERLSVGGTMRCLIDRYSRINVLRVYPYATPGTQLPSGHVLKFHKA
jgi:uncharacterized membrane protein